MTEKSRSSVFRKLSIFRRGSKADSSQAQVSFQDQRTPSTTSSSSPFHCSTSSPGLSSNSVHHRHTRHASLIGHEFEHAGLTVSSRELSATMRRQSSPNFDRCTACASNSKAVSKSSERRGQHKFHKLFNLDSSEPLLKSFPCALVGDILFQGTFYASEHFFCFHSKFAKKRKLIQVAVREVTNLTREKTAGIIPNAIALHTKHSRFVFASIIGRENIFRLLSNMWQSQVSASNTLKWVSNDGVIHDSSGDTDAETEEEVEVDVQLEVNCLEKSKPGIGEASRSDKAAVAPRQSAFRTPGDPADRRSDTYSSAMSLPCRQYLRYVAGLPRGQLCLLIAYVVLIFLAFSAVVLAWRIYAYQNLLLTRIEQMDDLQARMTPYCRADDDDCNLYRLRQQTHSTRIRHVHAVMSSNIRTLTDLARRLRVTGPKAQFPASPTNERSMEEEQKAIVT